jgi:hypothetical protein
MRWTLIIPAVVAVLLQSFSLLLVESEFVINRNYIASALCQNRAEPENSCGGKCYLKKEILRQQEQNEDQKNSSPSSFTFILYCEQAAEYLFFFPETPSLHFTSRSLLLGGYLETEELPPPAA